MSSNSYQRCCRQRGPWETLEKVLWRRSNVEELRGPETSELSYSSARQGWIFPTIKTSFMLSPSSTLQDQKYELMCGGRDPWMERNVSNMPAPGTRQSSVSGEVRKTLQVEG